MDIELNDVETRLLGCLLEKSMTTPDYYPLTLNSLLTACNQKSNRLPVVSFDEVTVARGLDSLKDKRLVVQGDSSRVPKYAEILVSNRNLLAQEAAILMVLMLRGPQTLGELRGRSERAFQFSNLSEVEERLAEMIESGYVLKLPRMPGRKEHRYAHLLAGEPRMEEEAPAAAIEPAMREIKAENDKISFLMSEVERLRAELQRLREDFSRFKGEFE